MDIKEALNNRIKCLQIRRQTVFTNRAILDREQQLIEEEMDYIYSLLDDMDDSKKIESKFVERINKNENKNKVF